MVVSVVLGEYLCIGPESGVLWMEGDEWWLWRAFGPVRVSHLTWRRLNRIQGGSCRYELIWCYAISQRQLLICEVSIGCIGCMKIVPTRFDLRSNCDFIMVSLLQVNAERESLARTTI